ncbi:MAG: PqqD family protein [Bacilli bacterium]|nr:PqqD family protein [Bacilli bacterium]
MRIKQGIIVQKIEDEYVLIDSGVVQPAFHGMIKLNAMGKEIIDILKNGDISIDEIVNALLSKYEASYEEVYESVNNFISELSKTPVLIK